MTQATPPFERIKPRPAYELVAEAIERKILGGRMRPGDPIGTESELVQQFGVNRSTVREGIRLLEQSGLVAREAEPPPVRGRAALPPAGHAHEPRAHPAAGDVPRAVAHLAGARAGLRRPGHGQRDGRGLRRSSPPTSTRCARWQRDAGAVGQLDARVPQADRQGGPQSRAAARQGTLQHAGEADHGVHHLQQSRAASRASSRRIRTSSMPFSGATGTRAACGSTGICTTGKSASSCPA